MKKCLINVDGGLGKHVMFTSILEEFKEKKGYDEIYVISSYFDVFKSCSVVTDVITTKTATRTGITTRYIINTTFCAGGYGGCSNAGSRTRKRAAQCIDCTASILCSINSSY